MDIKLQNCPLCGKESRLACNTKKAHELDSETGKQKNVAIRSYFVWCTCGLNGVEADYPEQAIDSWNVLTWDSLNGR